MKTPQPQIAMAAAKAPTAPPIKAIAFGIDPAGARPVLGVATALIQTSKAMSLLFLSQ
jgi:hypothetical protein